MKSVDDGMLFFDSIEDLFLWKNVQIPLNYKLNNFTWTETLKRPKTLVCHDHRGGYLEYESLQGSQYSNKSGKQIPFYSFFHWWYVDIFVYFSHHFVTVPPDVWILAAHQHGVLILDGWLINIENEVRPEYLDRLEWFLKELRRELRDKVHNCTQVIWYDSVLSSGKLDWQNELNSKNSRWFSVVDGFYTNYCWNESHLQRTLQHFYKYFSPEKSPFDIFMGIDVFGRNCTGCWDCDKPMEIIRRYDLSVAIFAPGWTCENCPIKDQKISLFDNSERLWNLLKVFFLYKLIFI